MGSFARTLNRKATKADNKKADDRVANAVAWAMGDVDLTRRTRAASRKLGLPPMELVTLLVAPEMRALVARSGLVLETEVKALGAFVSVPVPLANLLGGDVPWVTDTLMGELMSEKKLGDRVKPAHQTLLAYVSATESLGSWIELARLNETAETADELGAIDHIGAGGA